MIEEKMNSVECAEVKPEEHFRFTRILVYYLIAIGLSALSRFYWHTGDLSDGRQGMAHMYWHLVGGSGPAIGAIAVWAIFKPKRIMSFGGTFPPMAWAMLAVPAAVMGAIGIDNPYMVDPHVFGVHMGVWIALYGVLEETGWRGYLQPEFRNRPALLRYTIVGLFWYVWHLSFLENHPLGDEISTVLFMILASIGIGFVADRTYSIFAAAAFHVIGNIMGLTTDFQTLIPSSSARLMLVAACLVIWIPMLRIWRLRVAQNPGAAEEMV